MIGIVIKKEFRQIFRNPNILRMMMVMPIIQLIIIPFAADYEIKNIDLAIVNQDNSSYSQRLVQKLVAGNYFQLVEAGTDYRTAQESIEKGHADLIITIPHDFEKNIIKENKATISISADAVNGVKAGLGNLYANQIIGQFNAEIREELLVMPRHNEIINIQTFSQNRYNPHNDYHLFMVPGILALLVTMVGALISTLNIVSEKEKGTIEQINVTPLKKYQFIIGKLTPFWILGMISITIGFIISYVVFGIVSLGGYLSIYLYSGLYLLAVLGIGLLLSTFVDTQQQATLFSFFLMMNFVLLSGLYTAVESMPGWARFLSDLLPPSHFIKVIRSIFIKGSSVVDILPEFGIMAIFAVVLNGLAVLNYRKRA
ncbi:MAG: ABC transporter permease [Saprospiraceae bacterium]|nr:ABC transporter permease [Saprospiraceae bacterium]